MEWCLSIACYSVLVIGSKRKGRFISSIQTRNLTNVRRGVIFPNYLTRRIFSFVHSKSQSPRAVVRDLFVRRAINEQGDE